MNKLIKINKKHQTFPIHLGSGFVALCHKKPPELKRIPTVNINTTTQMYLQILIKFYLTGIRAGFSTLCFGTFSSSSPFSYLASIPEASALPRV